MLKCKFCEIECKNLVGLGRHNRLVHNKSTEEFKQIYADYYPKKKITPNMIECKICHDYFLPLGMPSHLSNQHQLSSKKYYDQYCKAENEGKCKICSKPTSFGTVNTGYRLYCSSKCANNDPDVQQKVKQNYINKYGVAHQLQRKEVQDKIRNTCQEKYGVDSFMQTKSFREKAIQALKSEEVIKKRKQTCLDRYGVENPMQSKEVQNKVKQTVKEKYGTENVYASEYGKAKIKETNLAKYGCENPAQNEEIKKKIHNTIIKNNDGMGAASSKIKNKMKQTNIEKYGCENVYQAEEIKKKIKVSRYYNIKQFCEENDCTAIIDLNIEFPYLCVRASGVETLTYNKNKKYIYNKDIEYVKSFEQKIIDQINNHQSSGERKIYMYIKSIYEDEVIQRTRQIIKPLELDLYIPNLNLAIEYNGTYYHSIIMHDDKYYHLNKSLKCRELGIRLIHIYEFEDIDEQLELLKSLILGEDKYPENDFNKNNMLDIVPKPEIIYKKENCVIYGAGKLY